MTFLDFFAGIGGVRIGMERAGHQCVGYCEMDKFANASYRSMHTITEEQREYLATLPQKERIEEIQKEEYLNGEWYANDIRTIRVGDIPSAECWCAGFPCQDCSISGKRLGFYGSRSSLVFQITRLLDETREEEKPEWLFFENVRNLLSVNNGWDFARLLIELDGLGYDAEWQVINSKLFVPQNRERIFIIGHIRNGRGSKVFPIGLDNTTATFVQGHEDRHRIVANAVLAGNRLAQGTYPIEGGVRHGTDSQQLQKGIIGGRADCYEAKFTDTAPCLLKEYEKGVVNQRQPYVAVFKND